jgi:hypothetical protein
VSIYVYTPTCTCIPHPHPHPHAHFHPCMHPHQPNLHLFILISSPCLSSSPSSNHTDSPLCLQVFKHATLKLSRAFLSIAEVLPILDKLDRHLTSLSLNRKLHSAVRASANVAKAALNKYYSLTDAALGYRIAMGMCTFI